MAEFPLVGILSEAVSRKDLTLRARAVMERPAGQHRARRSIRRRSAQGYLNSLVIAVRVERKRKNVEA